MSTLPEQFSAATKANLDAQLAILSTFTNKAFESIEKVVELNLTAAKTSLEESNAHVKKLIKDPQEFFNLTSAQANADKASQYARHLASIFSTAQAELTKTTEAHVADTNRKVIELVEETFKKSNNIPVGSENLITFYKSVIGNVHASYEQFNKLSKQALEQFTQVTTNNNVQNTAKKV